MSKTSQNTKNYLSPSRIKTLDEGEFSFIDKYVIKTKKEASKAAKKGADVHKALSQAVDYFKGKEFIVEPKFPPQNTKKGKQEKEEFYSKVSKDKEIITNDQMKVLKRLALILTHHLPLKDRILRNEALFETPIQSEKYELFGVPDISAPDLILDHKTGSYNAQKNIQFFRLKEEDIAVQAALYSIIYEDKLGESPDIRILAIQSTIPYSVKLYQIQQELFELGKRLVFNTYLPRYKKLIGKLRDIFKADVFSEDFMEKYTEDEVWRLVAENKIIDLESEGVITAPWWVIGDMEAKLPHGGDSYGI